MMAPRPDHWDSVYATKPVDRVSWYRPHLDESLRMIDALGLGPEAPIIDVGAGASTLIDDLLARGFRRLTALDISSQALALLRSRLGGHEAQVTWIPEDVLTARLPQSEFELWHDRATLHFLIEPRERAAYVDAAARALRPGGHAIVAGFGPTGPTRCSDLDVLRAGPTDLAATLGARFRLVQAVDDVHRTPWGAEQAFVTCLFRREGARSDER